MALEKCLKVTFELSFAVMKPEEVRQVIALDAAKYGTALPDHAFQSIPVQAEADLRVQTWVTRLNGGLVIAYAQIKWWQRDQWIRIDRFAFADGMGIEAGSLFLKEILDCCGNFSDWRFEVGCHNISPLEEQAWETHGFETFMVRKVVPSPYQGVTAA